MTYYPKSTTTLRRFLMGLIAGACVAALPISLLAAIPHATGMRDLDATPDPVSVGAKVTFSVQLVDNTQKGAPLAGKTVTFYVKWNASLPLEPVGSAVTDSKGYARTTPVVVPDYALGPKQLVAHRGYTAHFEGDASNGRHYHSGKTFTVRR